MSRFTIGSVSGEGHSFGDGNRITNIGSPAARTGVDRQPRPPDPGENSGGGNGGGGADGSGAAGFGAGGAGSGGRQGRLTAPEISELARAYPTPARSVLLLRRAGFPAEALPRPDAGLTPLEYWDDIAEWITYGLLDDGRRLLLDAARLDFPANPVFGHPATAGGEPGVRPG